MLRPSYTELMEVLNNDENVDMKVTSRYTIVIAAARRARQLIDGSEPLARASSDKAVSIAINEMFERKIKIITSKDYDESTATQTDDALNSEEYLNQEE